MLLIVPVIINEIIARGASFCHVERIKQDSHEIDIITDGYQRWHGAIPTFRSSEISNRACIKFVGIDIENHRDILAINIILDPRA